MGGDIGAGLLIVSMAEAAHGPEVFLWKSGHRERGWGGVGREQVVQAMCEARGDVRVGQAAGRPPGWALISLLGWLCPLGFPTFVHSST